MENLGFRLAMDGWPNPTLTRISPPYTDSKKWLSKKMRKLHGPDPRLKVTQHYIIIWTKLLSIILNISSTSSSPIMVASKF